MSNSRGFDADVGPINLEGKYFTVDIVNLVTQYLLTFDVVEQERFSTSPSRKNSDRNRSPNVVNFLCKGFRVNRMTDVIHSVVGVV